MKICGNCGIEYRCCKTGMTIHDEAFHPDSRHQADLYFCPVCHSVHIERARDEYFGEAVIPHVTITNDPEEPLLWDVSFVNKIDDQYGVCIATGNIHIPTLLHDIKEFRTSGVTINSTPEELIGEICYADDIISALLLLIHQKVEK